MLRTTFTQNLEQHPAVIAFNKLSPHCFQLDRIETLYNRNNSNVLRLVGAGPDGSTVIAKCSEKSKALLERTIYETVLPRLPVSQLRYFGTIEDGEFCWLFLEDAGHHHFTRSNSEQRDLVGRWLAQMHAHSLPFVASVHLPDRGPDYFLSLLKSAHKQIEDSLCAFELTSEKIAYLKTIVSQFRYIESKWDFLCSLCSSIPSTLVHGDSQAKNFRVRSTSTGTQILGIDWEYAGYGFPGIDLIILCDWGEEGEPHSHIKRTLHVYWQIIHDYWPKVQLSDLYVLARVGRLFRSVQLIYWKSCKLDQKSFSKSLERMKPYAAGLASAITELNSSLPTEKRS